MKLVQSFFQGHINDSVLAVLLNGNFLLWFFYMSYYHKMSGIIMEEKCVQEKKFKDGFF